MGSVEAARRAGRRLAAVAAKIRIAATTVRVSGSREGSLTQAERVW